MDETQQMLRAIINNQSDIKSELKELDNNLRTELKKLDNNLKTELKKLENKVDKNHQDLTDRLDKIGLQLAYLEDDAPTREEFEELEQKVNSLSIKLSST